MSVQWLRIFCQQPGLSVSCIVLEYTIMQYQHLVSPVSSYLAPSVGNRLADYAALLNQTIIDYTRQYQTILDYTILYQAILDYTRLYQTILYYSRLYYTRLYYTILGYTRLYQTILDYTILQQTILYQTILYYTRLYQTILDCSIRLTETESRQLYSCQKLHY